MDVIHSSEMSCHVRTEVFSEIFPLSVEIKIVGKKPQTNMISAYFSSKIVFGTPKAENQ